MKYIVYLCYSIGVMITWGLLLLDINNPGNWGIVVALLFSYYSPHLMKTVWGEDNRYHLLLKFLFPCIYLITSIYTFGLHPLSIVNPILIAWLLLVAGQQFSKIQHKMSTQFFVFVFIFVYSFSIFNYWESFVNKSTDVPYDFSKIDDNKGANEKKELFNYPISTNLILSDFSFLNEKLEETKIATNNQLVLIETWNEQCIPCINAIKDLQPYFSILKDKVAHYYVYEPRNTTFSSDLVFQFPEIKEKSKILIDENSEMYSKLKISGYPYFLLYDFEGNLINVQFGYNNKSKKEFQNHLTELIDSAYTEIEGK